MKMDANIGKAFQGVMNSSREIIKNEQKHLYPNVSKIRFFVLLRCSQNPIINIPILQHYRKKFCNGNQNLFCYSNKSLFISNA